MTTVPVFRIPTSAAGRQFLTANIPSFLGGRNLRGKSLSEINWDREAGESAELARMARAGFDPDEDDGGAA